MQPGPRNVIPLPSSSRWVAGYDLAQRLEAEFPDQDGGDFAYAVYENINSLPVSGGSARSALVGLLMTQQGERDGEPWIWLVEFDKSVGRDDVEGRLWWVTGWCDYTGWDCQSSLSWALYEDESDLDERAEQMAADLMELRSRLS